MASKDRFMVGMERDGACYEKNPCIVVCDGHVRWVCEVYAAKKPGIHPPMKRPDKNFTHLESVPHERWMDDVSLSTGT